jgi:hypothetical protein
MPRVCTICRHAQRPAIDRALVSGEPYRHIAERFGTSATALTRHKADHLPAALAKAHEASEVAAADDLLGQIQELRRKAIELLGKAEKAGDYRTALMGIREARACIETLLEVEGELDRRPTVNLVLSPEWIALRASIVAALQPYPDASTALVHFLDPGEKAST